MYKPFIVLIAAFGLAFNAGCGAGPAGDFCAAHVQCEGGNDLDVNACIANAHGDEAAAAAYDCSPAYAKVSDCLGTTSVCNKGHFQNSCQAASDALTSCIRAASGHK